jgi:hypothetical protein
VPPALHELQANGGSRLEFRMPQLLLATLDDREPAHHGWDVRGRRTGSLQVCETGLALGIVLVGWPLSRKRFPRATEANLIHEVA